MTADEVEKLERERRDADARYNDALTALDRAIVALRGRDLSPEQVGPIGSALLEFLQQITRFVDTKDRQLAAQLGARIDLLVRGLDHVDELKTQVTVLRRAMETARVGSPIASSSEPLVPQPPSARLPQSPGLSSDVKYVGFEDRFRGSDAAVEERLRSYLPVFAGCADILDIGCGRGELLAALRTAGLTARGIDANESMVAAARDRGLEAIRADALAYLEAMLPASLGGIAATQVVEHLEPGYLMRLVDAAARALRPGAPIVVETINVACWLAFFSSYVRDVTHVRPIHPETLQYLLRASGFERVSIRYSAAVPDHMKMKTVDLPPEARAPGETGAGALGALAHAINANAVILNNLMFTHLDYAAIGYRM